MPVVSGSWPIFCLSLPAMHAAALRVSADAAPEVTWAASTPSRPAMCAPAFRSSSGMSTQFRFASAIRSRLCWVSIDPPFVVSAPAAFISRLTPRAS